MSCALPCVRSLQDTGKDTFALHSYFSLWKEVIQKKQNTNTCLSRNILPSNHIVTHMLLQMLNTLRLMHLFHSESWRFSPPKTEGWQRRGMNGKNGSFVHGKSQHQVLLRFLSAIHSVIWASFLWFSTGGNLSSGVDHALMSVRLARLWSILVLNINYFYDISKIAPSEVPLEAQASEAVAWSRRPYRKRDGLCPAIPKIFGWPVQLLPLSKPWSWRESMAGTANRNRL